MVFWSEFLYPPTFDRITDHGTGMNFWDKLDDPELAKQRVSAAKALFEYLGLSDFMVWGSIRSEHQLETAAVG